MTPRARTLALASLFLTACPRTEPPVAPIPVAMAPAQGTGSAPLPVSIQGLHFDARAQTDFEGGAGSLDASFRAALLPEGGGAAVALAAVRLTADRRLEASVPAGIARGLYALEVTGPTGLTGTLGQAFRVVGAPETVVAFRVVPTLPAFGGVPFLLSLAAVDGAGDVVDGFTGEVALSDLSGSLTPSTSGPFVLGQRSLWVTVGGLSTSDRITATDAAARTGTSAAFAVGPGPAVAIVFTSPPVTVRAGACSGALTLGLRDAQGNVATAAAAMELALQSSPAGSLAFHGPGATCTSPTTSLPIAPGASSASFAFTGAAAGDVTIRVLPSGLPSVTQAATLTP